MGQVMIKCPRVGGAVQVGMEMPQGIYDAITFRVMELPKCPRCGDSHTWTKADAWVEE
jgi:uncharacterized C2H2 Zn-finger protein